MSKGVTPVIMAIMMILLVLILSISFFVWSTSINKEFEYTVKNISESQSQKSRTNFFIINAAGNQVGVKNNGDVSIELDEFYFFMNGTKYDSVIHQSPSPTTLGPSQIAIFNITGTYNDDYVVKVTGPYGVADQVFTAMTNP